MAEQLEPGRELDARVHRALWPDTEIGWRACETDAKTHVWASWQRLMYRLDKPIRYNDWVEVPAYSTNLMAWNGVNAPGW